MRLVTTGFGITFNNSFVFNDALSGDYSLYLWSVVTPFVCHFGDFKIVNRTCVFNTDVLELDAVGKKTKNEK